MSNTCDVILETFTGGLSLEPTFNQWTYTLFTFLSVHMDERCVTYLIVQI